MPTYSDCERTLQNIYNSDRMKVSNQLFKIIGGDCGLKPDWNIKFAGSHQRKSGIQTHEWGAATLSPTM